MPRKKKRDTFADILNRIATEVAGLEEGEAARLEELYRAVTESLLEAPPDAVAGLTDIARSLLELRLGERPFNDTYEELSARVESAQRAADGPATEKTEPLTASPDELAMDLAVLRGLLEEGVELSEAAAFMGQILARLNSMGLPSPLASALLYLSDLVRAAGRMDTSPVMPGEILAALAAAEKTLERLRETACPVAGEGPRGPGSSVSCDQDRVESFLHRLEEMEAELLALENGTPEGDGAEARVIALVHDLAREHDSLSLGACAGQLRELATVLSEHKGAFPQGAFGPLLELKDLLESHLVSILEEERQGDIETVARKSLALAEGLRGEARGPKGRGRRKKSAASGKKTEGAGFLVLQADEAEVRDFLAEAPEYVQMIEASLLDLERDPSDSELLNEAFRGFHNLKGSAGFLKLSEIVEVSHAAESLLAEAREGRLLLSGPLADLAFEALDTLKALLEGVERTASGDRWPVPEGVAELAERLRHAAAGDTPVTRARSGRTKGGVSLAPALDAGVASAGGTEEGGAPGKPNTTEQPQALQDASGQGRKGESLVRVSTTRLDALIDAVGELVIAHSMVMQEGEIANTRNPRLARNLSQLTKITRELQELAMGMRMVSLKNTFQKMARLARDLAVKSGTPLDFTFSGEDTEIDRNLVEEINSPLVHMVRNAVDHGLEDPEERLRAGKPERGRVELRGYHEGGNVVIELRDDGRGLDAAAILDKALRLGVVSGEEASRMSEDEVYRLIFHEGLSTARRVTDISGRGVGMDVVKRTIEGLRGRVDIASQPGRGTVFTIRLPLTLAIIDGMVVKVGEEEFVVPSISIHSSFRPQRDQVFTVAGKGEVISLRGEVIPLYRLHRLFGLRGARQEPWEALALIMGSNGDRCAVMVDDIVGQQQVVIKSLGEMFSRLPGVSGGAIMGSGKVALILDPPGLVSLAHGKGVR